MPEWDINHHINGIVSDGTVSVPDNKIRFVAKGQCRSLTNTESCGWHLGWSVGTALNSQAVFLEQDGNSRRV